MKVAFDTKRFCEDFKAACERRNLSAFRVCKRYGIVPGTVYKAIRGEISDITVKTLIPMLHFMAQSDIRKYIIEVNEEKQSGKGTGSQEAV